MCAVQGVASAPETWRALLPTHPQGPPLLIFSTAPEAGLVSSSSLSVLSFMERPSGRGAMWAARPELRAWHTQVSRARGSSAVAGNGESREARGAARREAERDLLPRG